MVQGLRSRSLRAELRTGLDRTVPEAPGSDLVAQQPAAPTISRRGALALVASSSLVIFLTTVGEATGGRLRRLAVFGTHYRSSGRGPNDFPVNHTAAAMGIPAVSTGPGWRLSLEGHGRVYLSRHQLLALTLTTASLPIACTEGWSTQQRWTGVPLADLARLAGVANPGPATLKALDGSTVVLSGEQVSAPGSLLALRVNGADLSLDHGFPARVIVPAMPGSYNLKWMSHIIFGEEA